jgi:replicative DNA helicase
MPSGAYKCFAGCTALEIRAALNVSENRIIPTALATTAADPRSVTVSPQRVKEAHERLLNSEGPAKAWLQSRGLDDGLMARYQLGVVRAKAGDRHLPAISIPIPNHDGTAYYQKKRIAPWRSADEQPPGYQPWSQAGIPARAFITYLPVEATATWLCEGEWDAMLLGQHVRQAELPIAVASFTAGAGNVPPQEELKKLPGNVVVFYDRNDKPTKSGLLPGEEGAKKVAAALGDRASIALVPMTDGGDVHGWDVSNALSAGFNVTDFLAAAEAATTSPPELEPTAKPKPNTLRSRLVTNAQLMATAPDYVEWLVPDLLPANELIMLAAGPRAGKSLLAMLLAKSVATGESFLDRPVTQGAVLYVRCEDAPVKVKQRQIAQGWAEDVPVYWLDRFKLSETSQLRELAEELEARLIVLDTLSRIRDDGTTESSAEMSRVLEPLQELAEDLNCSIVLVHHTGKVNVDNANAIDVFDTIRGSSAIRATCRGSMVLAADSDCYRLCAENGYGKMDLKIRLDGTTLEWKLLGRWTDQVSSDLKSTVLEYLTQVTEATLDQIFDETQIPKNSLYKTLSRLVRDNMLTKAGHRRKIVYRRSIGLIGQSDTLSDDAIAHGDDATGTYRTKNTFSSLGDQSDQWREGDHSTNPNSDHLAPNDHLESGSQKTLNCQVNPANVYPAREISSDKSSDKRDLSDETDEPSDHSTNPNSDHLQLTSAQSDQAGDHSPVSNRDIRPGDRVRYCGKSSTLDRLCGSKWLDVLQLDDAIATVQHSNWLVTQKIPVSDLQRARRSPGGSNV